MDFGIPISFFVVVAVVAKKLNNKRIESKSAIQSCLLEWCKIYNCQILIKFQNDDRDKYKGLGPIEAYTGQSPVNRKSAISVRSMFERKGSLQVLAAL